MKQILSQFFKNACIVGEQIPELIFLGDPILKTKTVFTYFEQALETCKQLEQTLTKIRAITGIGRGLAAPQIGSNERCFVTFVDNEFQYFINPELISCSHATNYYRENCLSCGPITCDVERAQEIRLRFIDKNGIEQEKSYDGFWARLLQHEYDHLEGIINVMKTDQNNIELLCQNPLDEILR
jgi:peptide deformylase